MRLRDVHEMLGSVRQLDVEEHEQVRMLDDRLDGIIPFRLFLQNTRRVHRIERPPEAQVEAVAEEEFDVWIVLPCPLAQPISSTELMSCPPS